MSIGLAAAFAYAARAMHRSPGVGAFVFIVCWFVFSGVDLVAGVRAGYSLVEELGIHLLLFIVPAAGAWLAARFQSP